MNKILQCQGSLLSPEGYILSPYDISKHEMPEGVSCLQSRDIYNYTLSPFSVNYRAVEHLTIINGMGVTLGDSIVGISVLDAIKKTNPDITITVIRPETAPFYVEEIYHLANDIIDNIHYMPFELSLLAKNSVKIDTGNQLYWPEFHTCEMHDFFIKGVGLQMSETVLPCLSNSWLNRISTSKVPFCDYVLFSPLASTAIRMIPHLFYTEILDRLYQQFAMQIVGFVDIEHPHYKNIALYSTNTAEFISVIRHAHHVYTCDSAALHIAAGFSVPTTCIFNTIMPALRVKYYPYCEAFYIGDERLLQIQNSEDIDLLNVVQERYRRYFYD